MRKDILFTHDDGQDVTFEDLLKRVYDNSVEKQTHLIATADQIKPMIQNVQDAVVLLPLLVDLQNASIRNDEQLIKMAAIVERHLGKSSKSAKVLDIESFGISVDERNNLLERAKQMRKEIPGESSTD
jgi:hypothetical protein